MSEDGELLGRYATRGDNDAFSEFVQRRFGLVYAVALRQVGGDEHLARDVAQHVFQEVARQAPRLAQRPVVTGWLYRTARFTAIDLVRAERRRRTREQEANLMHAPSSAPGSDADWKNLRPVLDDVLSELQERDRDAILLRVLEDRSFAEIARALRLTENSARMRFERALEKLRQRLRRHGITSTVAGLTLALANQATASVPAGLPATIAGEALAGAKLAGLAAGGLGLMSSTKTIGAIAATLTLLATGVGVYEIRITHRTETALAQLAPEIAALQARRTALTAELARPAVAPSRPALKTTAAAISPAASSVDAVSSDAITRMNAAYETNLRLRTGNPEYQRLYERANRAGTRLDYAALYRALGLTPAHIEAFESIVARQAGAIVDLQGAIRALGLKPDDPAAQQISDRADREFHRAVEELLGPAGYQKFLVEENLAPVHVMVRDVAGTVAVSDTPLTAAQSEQLTGIIARHDPRLAEPGAQWNRDKIDWPAIVADARSVLSPLQIDALQGYAARSNYGVANFRVLNERRRQP